MSLLRLVFRLLLGRRLPRTDGRLAIPGLFGTVRIGRDGYGIALLEADDPRDGPFALGFCHAQDRLFQMELMLRVARGTLAELVGPAAVPVDRIARRIGFHRSAAEQWDVLDADVRERIEHYSRGAQAGALYGLTALPHEFALLKARPTPWTPLDTLGVTKLLSFTLAANWDAELVRLKVLTADGPDAVRAVDSTYPAWGPADTAGAGRTVDRLADDLAAFLRWVRPGGASNNWVLDATRTATGRPLLANDPHLDARLPLPWYLASLRTPAEAVAGATFVGGPVWLAGHNGHAAWG
ncbi:MAG: penicillin acylase family protein [Gemmataceae bacterium]